MPDFGDGWFQRELLAMESTVKGWIRDILVESGIAAPVVDAVATKAIIDPAPVVESVPVTGSAPVATAAEAAPAPAAPSV